MIWFGYMLAMLCALFNDKVLRIALSLLLISLLSGCNSYRLSEKLLNEEIAQRLMSKPTQHIFVDVDDRFAILNLFIKGLMIDLRADNGGTAHIHLSANTQGTLFALNEPVDISTYLTLTVRSALTVRSGKIYLSDPKISDIKVQGEDFSDEVLRNVLTSSNPNLKQALAGYFYKTPIYHLTHSNLEKATKSEIENIRIRQDELLLTFY